MMTAELPLSGVTLYAPRLVTGLPHDRMQAMLEPWQARRQLVGERLVPYAQSLGAAMMDDRSGIIDEASFADQNTYSLFWAPGLVLARNRKLRTELGGKGVRFPDAKAIVDCADSELMTTPYVLYSERLQAGVGKYLIETEAQAEKVAQAQHDGLFLGDNAAFERREFIPTPGDHYTSYRVIVGPTGDILAAGLIYSAHSKRSIIQRRIRAGLNWRDVSSPREYGGKLVAAFEDPKGPYFLNARDIRSNMALGGHCVPLMGDRRRPLNGKDRDVLRQEGIDPDDPAVPSELLRQAPLIARVYDRTFGMAAGIDFVRHADSGDFYTLEVNFDIGLDTYRECWFGGDRSVDRNDLAVAVGRQALQHIAKSRKADPAS